MSDDSCRLRALVKACKHENDKLKVWLPIKGGLMNLILNKIKDYFLDRGQTFLNILHRALVSTTYYSILRVGEVTTGTHPILACNVHTAKNKWKIQLVLMSSKTHSTANFPQKITIVKNPSETRRMKFSKDIKFSLYEILMDYIDARGLRDDSIEPFFYI